jgi:formamidopyrimidine-DNA glycosylase
MNQLNSDQRIVEAIAGVAAKRNTKKLSKALQVSIYRRDGWQCRCCKRPVIFAPAMKLLQRCVHPPM